MQHFLLRCKHCGSKYTYCTYGNEDGCSMEYCGECQSAINESLDKIPKKIIKKFDYLTDIEEIFRINSIFDREKKLYDESNININSIPKSIPVVVNWGYKTVEKCYIDSVEYYRCIKDDGTLDIKVSKEYDLINGDYNGELYTENDKYRKCEYTPVEQCSLSIPKSIVEELSFQKPQGNLVYMNINFDNK